MSALASGSQISHYRLLVLRSALKLEILGMRRKGESVFSIIKREFGLRGNRQQVLEKFQAYIKQQEETV